jgi:chloramphenicol O-acetyltransferase type A
MCFQKIDLSTWNRKEYFLHYLHQVPCTYSATVQLDITNLRNQKVRLYPAMLYLLAKVVNRHEEFRMALNEQGEPGVFSQLHPSYTVFHKDTQMFSNLYTPYHPDPKVFFSRYEEDLATYGDLPSLSPQPDVPPNVFPVSMIPWMEFSSFSLHLQKGYDYLLPIFTMGKFHTQEGRTLLPLSLQVHHSVCDGFHASRFVQELQQEIFDFC